jgi:hypothetical protein
MVAVAIRADLEFGSGVIAGILTVIALSALRRRLKGARRGFATGPF